MSAKNYNEGKPRPSLILKDMAQAFQECLKVREAGAVKYDRMNFAESIGTDDAPRFLDENLDSIFRHLLAYLGGEVKDSESKCSHMAHVAIRAMFAVEYEKAEPYQWGTKRLPNLRRRDEMPEWLLDLIDQYCKYGDECQEGVLFMFDFSKTPEGVDFWRSVFEWQCGKGELPQRPTRFDWSKAPEVAKCAAINPDGKGAWYAEKPECGEHFWVRKESLYRATIDKDMLRDGEDWRETLEERPR